MRGIFFIWAVGVLALILSGSWALHVFVVKRDDDAFREQVRLARAEGLPTTAAEFAATIRPAIESENAAPYYRELAPSIRPLRKIREIDIALLRHPSPKTVATARGHRNEARPALAIIDRATALPRCWFDRRWSDGAATLMPEYADMRSAAMVLALRGSMAAKNGDSKSALKNAKEILNLSWHAGEEGTSISAIASQTIYSTALHEIADWCVLYPRRDDYRKGLAAALAAFPRPDIRRENRNALIDALSIVELCSNEAGRRKLGIRDDDRPSPEVIYTSAFRSRPKAKIQIVKAGRKLWAALLLPRQQRASALSDAGQSLDDAMNAFPVPWSIGAFTLGNVDEVQARLDNWEATKLEYAAVLRALGKGGVAYSIKIDDLKSPFDANPLTYLFDGTQIRIGVSHGAHQEPTMLTVPPDESKP